MILSNHLLGMVLFDWVTLQVSYHNCQDLLHALSQAIMEVEHSSTSQWRGPEDLGELQHHTIDVWNIAY